jgi:hypothetical protein
MPGRSHSIIASLKARPSMNRPHRPSRPKIGAWSVVRYVPVFTGKWCATRMEATYENGVLTQRIISTDSNKGPQVRNDSQLRSQNQPRPTPHHRPGALNSKINACFVRRFQRNGHIKWRCAWAERMFAAMFHG